MDDILAVLKQVEEEKILECSTTEEFYDRLLNIGCRSRAADHPYFHGMRDGTLPNVLLALCDYALQKSALHNHFKEARGCADEEYAATQPLRAIRMETPKAAPILINLEQRSISVVDAKYEDLFGRLLKALEREAGSEGLAMLPQVNVGRCFKYSNISSGPHSISVYSGSVQEVYETVTQRVLFLPAWFRIGNSVVWLSKGKNLYVDIGIVYIEEHLVIPEIDGKIQIDLKYPFRLDLEVLPEESQEHSSISSNTYSLGKPSV
ncbi:hypothetical protein Gasu2_20770 [Galdieria sulphuraria]|nr:hypothetical protein Gasu2_20770 [Galdieria sulphuraria]